MGNVIRLAVLFAAAVTIAACDDDPDGPGTPTAAPSATATATAPATEAPTSPPSPTDSPTPLPSPSLPPSPSPSTTYTQSPTPTAQPTDTSVPTPTPTLTASPSPTPSPVPATDRERIESLATTDTFQIPGLSAPVHVIRTEADVPHIYAANRRDLSLVHGFVLARDRYFMMDLTRRLGLGKTSALIGDASLDVDVESRLTGMTFVADRIAANFSREQRELALAFVAGVNHYIDRVAARELPPPSELRLATALLGARNPTDLMEPFSPRDLGAILAVIMYNSSYETGDVGRARSAASFSNPFIGDPFEELRFAGLLEDIQPSLAPVHTVSSAAGYGLETGDEFIPGPRPDEVAGATPDAGARGRGGAAVPVPPMLARLEEALLDVDERLGRVGAYGSNAWALSGSKTASGQTLVAGDGHLQLDIPPLFYQLGLDTSVFGGGPVHQLGLTIPGFLVMPVGTNGDVAWSQTQLSVDATDWYTEQLRLDDAGLPSETLFRGSWRPVVQVDETFEIADVPALDSVGRSETWPRWTTFDGRFLTEIEGRRASPDDALAAGESLVFTLSGFVVPGDTDGDGVVTAISFDYTAFDTGQLVSAPDGFGLAANIEEFREASRLTIGYSQNIVAGDKDGNVLYTAHDAIPCRGYLERAPNGDFLPGSDPRGLLDGTVHGGFEIPLRDGSVDETASDGDPQRCMVPFASTPESQNPSRGYVLSANNDPADFSFDNSIYNDGWYIGGPWNMGFRAVTIDRALAAMAESRDADVDAMAALQSNRESRLGEQFAGRLVEAVESVTSLPGLFDSLGIDPNEPGALEAAGVGVLADLWQLYLEEGPAFEEIRTRLESWIERGFEASSGVATFYSNPSPGDADDAVATMIFNAWLGRFVQGVFDDEGFPGGTFARGDLTRIKLLDEFLRDRDTDGPSTLASHNPATGESIFFDRRGTETVETSVDIMLQALVDALAFLRSEPSAPGEGGFGTIEMDQWLWGLRHQVRFESLLAPFLGNDPAFEIFTRPFNIDTNKLPLDDGITPDDPRFGLRWFPRPGDQWGVDAANPGLSGVRFTHGNGPVMRMVFGLKDGEVEGYNVIPGGQSALTDSLHFADQAALWLANEALPLRFSVTDVVAGALAHEIYEPDGCRKGADCNDLFEYCQDPAGLNAKNSCGICIQTDEPIGNVCATNADCGEEGEVCDDAPPVDCYCDDVNICQPACGDSRLCATGESCREGRCEPQACGAEQACPAAFTCDDEGAVCVRRECTRDADCPSDYCVNGRCHDAAGMCAAYGV